jgi:putative SOS response-associated peptidase YedK
MCGRYSLAPDDINQLRIQFRLEARVERSPRYNSAPSWNAGHVAPIVYDARGVRQLEPARWWMIPSYWSRPLSELPTAFNARAEDIGHKRFWAGSYRSRRCLVPATGWREFSGPRGDRTPHHFHLDGGLFAFAGLFDTWRSPEGQSVRSFAIVTVAASDVVQPVHDRMPLCVSEPDYAAWLSPELSGAEAFAALRATPAPPLRRYEASRYGNDSQNEGPECIARASHGQLRLF